MITEQKKGIIVGLLIGSLFLGWSALVFTTFSATLAQAQAGASIECSFIGAGNESGSSGNVSINGSLGQWAVGGGASGSVELNATIWDCAASGLEGVFLPIVLK